MKLFTPHISPSVAALFSDWLHVYVRLQVIVDGDSNTSVYLVPQCTLWNQLAAVMGGLSALYMSANALLAENAHKIPWVSLNAFPALAIFTMKEHIEGTPAGSVVQPSSICDIQAAFCINLVVKLSKGQPSLKVRSPPRALSPALFCRCHLR